MTDIVYAFSDNKTARILLEHNKSNLLISYFYLRKRKNPQDLLDFVMKSNPNVFMLDSGAFSAWNNGDFVHLYDYIDFIKKYHQYFTHIVCLDVIDNPILSEVNHLIMQQELKDYNLIIIPVFHSGEPFATLDYMVEKGYKYLGISPNNNWMEPKKREWLNRVFNRYDFEKLGIKTHGFGYQSIQGLSFFPLTTADAFGWEIAGGFGRIIDRQNTKYSERTKHHWDNVENIPGGPSQEVLTVCKKLEIDFNLLKTNRRLRDRVNIELLDILTREKTNLSTMSEVFDVPGDFSESLVLETFFTCIKLGRDYKGVPSEINIKKKKIIKNSKEEVLF